MASACHVHAAHGEAVCRNIMLNHCIHTDSCNKNNTSLSIDPFTRISVLPTSHTDSCSLTELSSEDRHRRRPESTAPAGLRAKAALQR